MKKWLLLAMMIMTLFLTACQNQGRDVRRALIDAGWIEDEILFVTSSKTEGSFSYNIYNKMLTHQYHIETADMNRYYYIEVNFGTGMYEVDINTSVPGESFKRESHDGFLYENESCQIRENFVKDTCFPEAIEKTIDFFGVVLNRVDLAVTDLYDPDAEVITTQ